MDLKFFIKGAKLFNKNKGEDVNSEYLSIQAVLDQLKDLDA